MIALAIASVSAQDVPATEAAPEPYSYAYQTDSHAASEQRDPQGKVTGFYTLVDADGRERRVEYIADEAGFRAKIATNEVGTKSENPADVEILASEPTPNQYVVYQQSPQVQVQAAPQVQVQAVPQQVIRQQVVQQPLRAQVSYVQAPQRQATYGYGYYPGSYGYANNGGYYGTGYYGSGYGTTGYATTGNSLLNVGNYNNHLPSQYYRSVGAVNGAVVPSTYTVNSGNAVRYVTQPAGVRTVSYPAAGVSYGATYGVPAGVSTTTRTTAGSSNYIVLKKRSANEKK